jgi:hypothetical protein
MKNLLLSSWCLHSLSSLQSVIGFDKLLTPSEEHIPIRVIRPDNKHNIMRSTIDFPHRPSVDALPHFSNLAQRLNSSAANGST